MLSRFKSLIYILFFFALHLAPAVSYSQGSSEMEIFQGDDDLDDDEKKSKKKKKDKNDKNAVEINSKFFISLLIDLATVSVLILGIYYFSYRQKEFFFTYFIFNLIIFLITFLLNEVKISMGAAFGLFAVFSMLRYRTEGISMKDMTYLFIVIAVGLINAVQLGYPELAIINGIILVATFILDGNLIIKRELYKNIQYENIEMIKPQNQEKLLEDLRNRTGLNIHRISITKIDFLKDTAVVRIYYYN